MIINQAFLNERLRWEEDFGKGGPLSKLQPSKPCYCIYVGVGQKQSTIARISKILRKPRHLYERRFLDGSKEAPYCFSPLSYSVIVASISSDSALARRWLLLQAWCEICQGLPCGCACLFPGCGFAAADCHVDAEALLPIIAGRGQHLGWARVPLPFGCHAGNAFGFLPARLHLFDVKYHALGGVVCGLAVSAANVE
jgi:hypothetical protein